MREIPLLDPPDISMEDRGSSSSEPNRIRWLDPVLPSKREFYAYGTHVDDSGTELALGFFWNDCCLHVITDRFNPIPL